MKMFKKIIGLPEEVILYFLSAAIVTGALFTLYAVTEQNYRLSANDPQIQVAEDITSAIADGLDPQAIQLSEKIDMTKSLSAFIIIYDKDGKPITSSGYLDNEIPVPPKGVLDYTAEHGEDRVTWKPTSGTRIAAIIRSYEGGSVLVGRSLREVESRIRSASIMIGISWIISLALLTALAILKMKKQNRPAVEGTDNS